MSLVACGIFSDQGLNPLALYWKADSYPLYHEGSLLTSFKRNLFYFWAALCSIRDLSSSTKDHTYSPCSGRRGLHCRTTRAVPGLTLKVHAKAEVPASGSLSTRWEGDRSPSPSLWGQPPPVLPLLLPTGQHLGKPPGNPGLSAGNQMKARFHIQRKTQGLSATPSPLQCARREAWAEMAVSNHRDPRLHSPWG